MKLHCTLYNNLFFSYFYLLQTVNSLFSLNFPMYTAFSRLKLIMNVLDILSCTAVVRYEDSNS